MTSIAAASAAKGGKLMEWSKVSRKGLMNKQTLNTSPTPLENANTHSHLISQKIARIPARAAPLPKSFFLL
ncbi:hypothetical protein GcM3_064007 [Golovinomyces cichoracearum]|uniref:Uncharacterized protein n=1 Tax=Golovinomyces cichoracearum TaxID=62708 RepID=A0A420IV21_9PEZI|nr:hypothetical protein GcM3_064007 [Golovinomyces cichoracearum]